nr:MoxR family ATPase [Methylonatrum kenyense]
MQPHPSTPLARVFRQGEAVILGKQHQLRLAVTCLLAGGHLLIEDLPGVGKTTLAHLLSTLFGLQFQRVQFTSDLLPADITGASVFERESGTFSFHPGPVFTQLLLADEVNRATPKTQSALLEAMEERQVTVDGRTRPLPEPFFVVATQNPVSQLGTFDLPESQLDRFLMRIHLGFPDREAEHELLRGRDRRQLLAEMEPVLDLEQLQDLQRQAQDVFVSEALIDYVQALLAHTRSSGDYGTGLSPRAGLALLRAGRAWALLNGRSAVLPEDIQAVLPPVASHRLAVSVGNGDDRKAAADHLLAAVPVP